MNFKSIWNRLVSFKDRILRRGAWPSKNKAIIDGIHATARRAIENAYVPNPEDAEDIEERTAPSLQATTKPPERIAEKANDASNNNTPKDRKIPQRLSDILKTAQEGTTEGSLSQQTRIKNSYGAEAFYNAAKRLFKDRRISNALPTGMIQFSRDIRFLSNEQIGEAGLDAPEIEAFDAALYSVISKAFISAADPQNAPKKALNRIAILHRELRHQGILLNERMIEEFEDAIQDHAEGLKNPSTKIVTFKPKPLKPRDPDGMK